MSGSAEALDIIQNYVSVNGGKMRLGQVLSGGGDDVAGLGYDHLTDVSVAGLDERVFPDGTLSGRLACRAVLLEPGVSERFVGVPGVSGAVYLRTRLEYEEPGMSSLPDVSKALTIGGTVTQVAVHNLMLGDGVLLDAYHAELAAYEDRLRNGSREGKDALPDKPALHTHYGLQTPGVPNFNKGVDTTPKAERRLELRRMGFGVLQNKYPAARILSVSTQGYVSEHGLMDWAVAFTGKL